MGKVTQFKGNVQIPWTYAVDQAATARKVSLKPGQLIPIEGSPVGYESRAREAAKNPVQERCRSLMEEMWGKPRLQPGEEGYEFDLSYGPTFAAASGSGAIFSTSRVSWNRKP